MDKLFVLCRLDIDFRAAGLARRFSVCSVWWGANASFGGAPCRLQSAIQCRSAGRYVLQTSSSWVVRRFRGNARVCAGLERFL
jgi:hypothetical protein